MKKTVWPEILLTRAREAATLRQQIEQQIGRGIHDGVLPPGARLPSSRLLADLLGVSRGTVVDAYEALLEASLVLAEPGSGVRVAHVSPRVPNFTNLRRTAAAAHYPARVCNLNDPDGTPLYLNLLR
jgi:DNA-binding FadR family transcriptional regulator